MQKIVIGCVWLLFALAGCGSSGFTVYVASEPATNVGRPFYMLVRAVEQKSYLSEDYQEVVGKTFSEGDKSVLKAAMVVPGRPLELDVPREETLPVAVYFFFTRPGERWKTLVPQPLPSSLEFELGQHEIKSQN
jgi:hypothetical protein